MTPLLLSATLLIIAIHSSYHHVNAQTCYYPNGNPTTEPDGLCSQGDAVGCCPLNWACMSNGLCYLPNAGIYGRYTCSDSTWSSSCPQICTQNGTAGGNEAVVQCEDGRWCCDGNRSYDCCSQADAEFFSLPKGSQIAFISSVPSPTGSAKSTGSTSSAITIASASSPSPSSSISTSSPPETTTPASTSQTATSPTPQISASTTTAANGQVTTITLLLTPAATSTPSPVPATHHSNLPLIIALSTAIPLSLLLLGLITLYAWKNFRRHQRYAYKKTPNNSATNEEESPELKTAYGHFPPEGRAPELDSYPVAPTRSKSGRVSELAGHSISSNSPSAPSSVYSPQSPSSGDSPGQIGVRQGPFAWFSPISQRSQRSQQRFSSYSNVSSVASDPTPSGANKGLGLSSYTSFSPVGNGMKCVDEEEGPAELWGGEVPVPATEGGNVEGGEGKDGAVDTDGGTQVLDESANRREEVDGMEKSDGDENENSKSKPGEAEEKTGDEKSEGKGGIRLVD